MKYDPYLIDSHKIDLHPQRIAQWMDAKNINEKMNVFPLYVEVSPSGACNERCTFCSVDYIGYKTRFINIDIMKKCIDSMFKNGVKSVMYAGEGEPMLHKQMAEIANYTKKVGVDVAFTTNGTLMNEEFVETCLHNISWVKVSLNAGDAETYSTVHRVKKDLFNTVLKNITYAVTFRNINRLNTTIGVQTVVLPENIDSIEQLIIDSTVAGADYVVLKPYSQHHSSINKYDIDYNEWDYRLDNLSERYSTKDFKVIYRRNSALKKEPSYLKCYSTPFLWSYIMADGSLYACSAYLLNDRFNLGNINNNSFEEIWFSNKRRNLIEYIENELDISECRLNCRMDKVNEFQWRLKNPESHDAFI